MIDIIIIKHCYITKYNNNNNNNNDSNNNNNTIARIIITSPAGAVAKYCNERVCVCVRVSVCVCLSVHEHISRTTRAIFTIFLHVAYRRGSVLFRMVTQSQGKGTFLGVFFPTDNALYGKCSTQPLWYHCGIFLSGAHQIKKISAQIPAGLRSIGLSV